MSVLKSYSCSKCGAALVFEASQEILECPFCGTGFGSADFHGDELLDQAKSSLEQKAYAQAKEKRALEIEEPRVQHALAELKDKLIEMRSGSVFCK